MRPPDAEAAARFGPTGASAGAARRFVWATLESWDLDALADTATLLVSELVGNVVLHAGTDADVVVRRSAGRVRVEVVDGSSQLPVRKLYSDTATTGRGLALVEKLSTRWGAETSSGGGKSVWFELAEPAPGEAPAASGTFHLGDWTAWDLDR
jgi:anti-sigma regulatory factor (Ser/Thr protein kinase)